MNAGFRRGATFLVAARTRLAVRLDAVHARDPTLPTGRSAPVWPVEPLADQGRGDERDEHAELSHRGDLGGQGTVASASSAAPARCTERPRPADVAEPDVGGQEDRNAAAERERLPEGERVVGVAGGLLQPRGHQHDAEQQGVVRAAEALECDPRLPQGGGGGQRALGLLVVVGAEVRPPHPGGEQQAEHGDEDQLGVDGEPGGADADRHDRLADRHDHHQPVALDEVGRRDLEATLALAVLTGRTPPPGGRRPYSTPAPCRRGRRRPPRAAR